jgi:hypothetical protein
VSVLALSTNLAFREEVGQHANPNRGSRASNGSWRSVPGGDGGGVPGTVSAAVPTRGGAMSAAVSTGGASLPAMPTRGRWADAN